MPRNSNHSHFFILITSALCLFYLGFELFFNHYAMFSVDEFWFAHRIYHYKNALPYRDFQPYKTTLGYYFLLLPMLSGLGIIKTLVLTKHTIAFLNALILFLSSFWLTRFFSRSGILTGLVLIIFSEIFLFYSTQLRVDLFGYWFCFFSLLLLLEKRYFFAGLLIGLGFAATQKAVWYLFASNCALGACWLLRDNVRQIKLSKILVFNSGCFFIIILYLVCWSFVSDWETVFNNVFLDAYSMYQLDWYNAARSVFWKIIIENNPILFLLWPAALFSVLITYNNDKEYSSRLFIVIYSLAILACLVPFKQVFPYYMQVTFPILFLLYAACANWFINSFSSNQVLRAVVPSSCVMIMLIAYIAIIVFCVIKFDLPLAYLSVCLLPIFIFSLLYARTPLRLEFLKVSVLIILFVNFTYVLSLLPTRIFYLSGDYQKANLQTMNELLQDDSDYIAGIDLIYNKSQQIAGLKHLMGPAIAYLAAPNEKLKSVMLASLDEDPHATIASVITDLKKSSVKFYVNNYRMMALPAPIKDYLQSEYQHWRGSIYLYSPSILKGNHALQLKFDGHYFIESKKGKTVTLNKRIYLTNTIIKLNKGVIHSYADENFRLSLVPDNILENWHPANFLTDKYKKDRWQQIIF